MSYQELKLREAGVMPAAQLTGYPFSTPTNTSVTVVLTDVDGNILKAIGHSATIVAGQAGFAKGAEYIYKEAANNVSGVFTNIGTTQSCVFALLASSYTVATVVDEVVTVNGAGYGTLSFVPALIQDICCTASTVLYGIVPVTRAPSTHQVSVNQVNGVLQFSTVDVVATATVTYIKGPITQA